MAERVQKFEPASTINRLFQGEILSNLIQTRQKLETIGGEAAPVLVEEVHGFSIVVSQDCDLANDFRLRSQQQIGSAILPNVLFCQAEEAAILKAKLPPGKDIWKSIIQNKNERYHATEPVPPTQDHSGFGIGALLFDFKRYFTIPTDEVYMRIEIGQLVKRSKLITPYGEHITCRFYYYQSRIALPEDHDISIS